MKKKISITFKLMTTYLLIMAAAIICGVLFVQTLFSYQTIDNELILHDIPLIENLKKLNSISGEINKYAKNWVFLSNESDRNLLIDHIEEDFPKYNEQLIEISKHCNSASQSQKLATLAVKNESIVKSVKQILSFLNNFDSFFDEDKVEKAIEIYQLKIEFTISSNLRSYTELLKASEKRETFIFHQKDKIINYLISIVISFIFLILLFSSLSIVYTKRQIAKPLVELEYIISNITLGEVGNVPHSEGRDEIAEMQNSVRKMIDSLKEKINFANSIGLGNYNSSITLLSENDRLGLSLIEMSKKLQSNEEKILASQESLKDAQAIAKVGNMEVNMRARQMVWSDELYSIFEIEPTEDYDVLSARFFDKIHQEDQEMVRELVADTRKTAENYDFEFRLICDKERTKTVSARGYALVDETGKANILKAIFQDITDRKVIENKLQSAMIRAENLARAKDEFMSSMSHEIRTPLNGILGFTNVMLHDKNLSETQRKQLDSIKTSGDILLVIINDILDIAKIESGKMNIEQVPFNIRELSQLIIDTFAVKIREKQLNVNLNVGIPATTSLLGDPVRMSQIFFNFLSNAIKFTPKDGEISLNIICMEENETTITLKLQVKDSGIGIPKDKLDSVFEAFVQTSDDTARKFGGTGLGLTIVKKIVELMKGEVWVESELNEGSTFNVVIPFTKTVELAVGTDKDAEKSANFEDFDFSHIRILLAEDNIINQLLAQTILAQFNFEVITVENGKLALEAVEAEHFDLILMDLMMPEMDGYEASIAIRNLEDTAKKNIPIIALTADVTNSVTTKCKEVGMNDYMSKPFDSTDLKNKIVELTGNFT